MIEQNPLKIFLKRQGKETFKWAKYSLALFSLVLFLACIQIYSTSATDCANYKLCFSLLAAYHMLDALSYIHEV